MESFIAFMVVAGFVGVSAHALYQGRVRNTPIQGERFVIGLFGTAGFVLTVLMVALIAS
ncbi:MAG: hypothetical protein AAFZ18_10465 [Myxococcota bacterium]